MVYAATRPNRTLCPRIQKVGTFLGIRSEGKLVAMGGQRLHIAGYREITSVATLPDYEGRGYATSIMLALVARIRGARRTAVSDGAYGQRARCGHLSPAGI